MVDQKLERKSERLGRVMRGLLKQYSPVELGESVGLVG